MKQQACGDVVLSRKKRIGYDMTDTSRTNSWQTYIMLGRQRIARQPPSGNRVIPLTISRRTID
jgi:hypothetical protein